VIPPLRERRKALKLRPLAISTLGLGSTGAPRSEDNDRPTLEQLYDLGEKLGSGTTSNVHRAKRLCDGHEVVLKILRSRGHDVAQAAQIEFDMIKSLSHRNICRALDQHTFDGQAVLVFDFIQGRTLDFEVHHSAHGRLAEDPSGRLLGAQIFRVLDYLHKKTVLHRDIKPQNIVVATNGQELRLVDFNSAAEASESLSPAGTRLYAAPEVVEGEASDTANDVWMAALCVFFMLSGCLPQGRDHSLTCGQLRRIAKKPIITHGEPWSNVSDPCKALLQQCLSIEPTSRLCSTAIVKHPWVADEVVLA
jgi:serine/threonine protein kinase